MSFNPAEHMMQMKGGKYYLQVMWRLVWFREDHPDWSINADCIEHDQDHADFKSIICDDNGIQKSPPMNWTMEHGSWTVPFSRSRKSPRNSPDPLKRNPQRA